MIGILIRSPRDGRNRDQVRIDRHQVLPVSGAGAYPVAPQSRVAATVAIGKAALKCRTHNAAPFDRRQFDTVSIIPLQSRASISSLVNPNKRNSEASLIAQLFREPTLDVTFPDFLHPGAWEVGA